MSTIFTLTDSQHRLYLDITRLQRFGEIIQHVITDSPCRFSTFYDANRQKTPTWAKIHYFINQNHTGFAPITFQEKLPYFGLWCSFLYFSKTKTWHELIFNHSGRILKNLVIFLAM